MKSRFPIITLRGDNFEIGIEHGRMLKERIYASLEFYKKIWGASEEVIFSLAKRFQSSITKLTPHYADEIIGIAEGSQLDPLWIYALNSRTELLLELTSLSLNECTSAYFPRNSILAQNWDWAGELENLVVIMGIETNGHRIIQLTEPGIIGKIGFNNFGVGVCLNILNSGKKQAGIPVHVLLRLVLDSHSQEEAMMNLWKHRFGKSSNFLIGDSSGNSQNIEFAGDAMFTLSYQNEPVFHTNHYTCRTINTDLVKFASSFARYKTATEKLSSFTKQNIAEMKFLLRDKSNSELPICRPYIPDAIIGNSGTVSSIIMKLKSLEFFYTKGSPEKNEYHKLGFEDVFGKL